MAKTDSRAATLNSNNSYFENQIQHYSLKYMIKATMLQWWKVNHMCVHQIIFMSVCIWMCMCVHIYVHVGTHIYEWYENGRVTI